MNQLTSVLWDFIYQCLWTNPKVHYIVNSIIKKILEQKFWQTNKKIYFIVKFWIILDYQNGIGNFLTQIFTHLTKISIVGSPLRLQKNFFLNQRLFINQMCFQSHQISSVIETHMFWFPAHSNNWLCQDKITMWKKFPCIVWSYLFILQTKNVNFNFWRGCDNTWKMVLFLAYDIKVRAHQAPCDWLSFYIIWHIICRFFLAKIFPPLKILPWLMFYLSSFSHRYIAQ